MAYFYAAFNFEAAFTIGAWVSHHNVANIFDSFAVRVGIAGRTGDGMFQKLAAQTQSRSVRQGGKDEVQSFGTL